MIHFLSYFVIVILISCGSKDDTVQELSSVETGRLAISPLIDAAPAELQVASPTTANGQEVTLTGGTIAIGLLQDTVDENSFVAKFANFVNQANGTTDENCLPDLEVSLPSQPACYNQIVYKDSADGPISDTIFFASDIQARNIGEGVAVGLLDDGSGIIKELEDTAPCSKSVTEFYIDRIASSFDRAQALSASLLCVAKKSGITELPAVGEVLDLKVEAGELWPDLTLHLAQIKASTIAEKTAYNTILSISYQTDSGDNQDLIVDILNIPDDLGSGDYRGRVFIYDKKKVNANAGPIPTFISSHFQKNDSTIKMLTKEVGLNFTEEPTQFIDSTGMLDFSLFTQDNFEAPQNQAGGPSIGLMKFDTNDGTGTVSFQSSPALGGTEVSNAFIVTVEKGDDDTLSACALQGHGLSPVSENGVERASENDQDYSIYGVRGFYCMKGQQNGSQSFGEDLTMTKFDNQFKFVQKQCFSFSDEAWSVDSSNITFTVDYNVQGACGFANDDASKFDLVAVEDALEAVDETIYSDLPDSDGLVFDASIDYGIDFEYIP